MASCLAAFFWKRATPAGAVASMVAGMGAATAWEFWLGARLESWATEAGRTGLTEFFGGIGAALPAVAFSVLVLVGVSLATRPRENGA